MMKVLLASKYAPTGPRPIGGVQTWVATVATELRGLGHSVTIWSPELSERPSQQYDAGIISNLAHTRPALGRCRRVVVVSHGIIPDERPDPGLFTAFTSEGVRHHWGGDGPIVRQPIDLDFWSPGDGGGSLLLRYSYRSGLGFMVGLASRMDMAYEHLRNVTPIEARAAMRRSSCVLASGRAAVEAMACGVPVVICDHRSAYQGPLVDFDPVGAMTRNYSGRGGVEATFESVREAVTEAIAVGGLRAHAELHHDAKQIAFDLLEMAR